MIIMQVGKALVGFQVGGWMWMVSLIYTPSILYGERWFILAHFTSWKENFVYLM